MSKPTKKCETILRALRKQTENKTLMITNVKTRVDMLAIMNEVSLEPDNYQMVDISRSRLTDEDGGLFLAEVVEHSTTLVGLCLRSNRLTERTVIALARALVANSSLEALMITRDSCVSLDVVYNAMFCSLRLNPLRPAESTWIISESGDTTYKNLYPEMKRQVDQLGHPSLLFLLSHSPLL